MTDRLRKYESLIDNIGTRTVYQEPWYLQSVCKDGNLDFIEGEEYLWPYFMKKKGMFRYITMPHLCKWMGPILKDRNHSEFQIEDWLQMFPKFHYLEQNLFYDTSSHIEGLDGPISCYSYEIDLSKTEEELYKNVHADYRNNKFPKAKNLNLKQHNDPEELVDLQFRSYDHAGFVPGFDRSFTHEHVKAIISNGQGSIFSLTNEQGQTAASVCLIWDASRAYYHLAGMNPSLKKTAASIRLIWDLILYAKNELKLDYFDFEGSMIPSLERVRKNFGAEKRMYYKLKQEHSALFKWVRRLRRS